MTRELERRNTAQLVELRAAKDPASSPGTLFGYAAKFGLFSQNLGGFVEVVGVDAFSKSLADDLRVLCRYNHNDMALLGASDSGTLTLGVDEIGLWYEDVLPDTQYGRDCAVLAARGDLCYSSFAFYTIEDEWALSPQGFPLRTLLAVQLLDVAPVNTPAYLDSTVALRSLSERIDVPMAELAGTQPEEIRARLAGETFARPMVPVKGSRALDPEDTNMLTQALGWVTSIDATTTLAMDSLSEYLKVPNPDADDGDAVEANSLRDDAEQRDTHSTPVNTWRMRIASKIE